MTLVNYDHDNKYDTEGSENQNNLFLLKKFKNEPRNLTGVKNF